MQQTIRKYLGLFCAIVSFFLIHEGAHLVLALKYGVFEGIRFLGLGMQIVITEKETLSNLQLAFLNVSGVVATLIAAYLLVFFTKKICQSSSLFLRSAAYYTTLALLLSDPIYLSLLFDFFGGGDMNGIVLFGISKSAARAVFFFIGLVNAFIFFRFVYPLYTNAFARDSSV